MYDSNDYAIITRVRQSIVKNERRLYEIEYKKTLRHGKLYNLTINTVTMAHLAQKQYCELIKAMFPEHFVYSNVLDVWSLDINGNNRYLFKESEYTGIDVWPGPNVDIVCSGHEYKSKTKYDVVISTEMLEHNKYWKETLQNMYKLLVWGWLMLITCAWEGRAEHWTTNSTPQDAPFTNEYYKNFNESMLREAFDLENMFSKFEVSNKDLDFRFYGIKKCN